MSPLAGGTANVSFLVGSAARAVVTFFTDIPVDEVESLGRLLLHLVRRGFWTSRPWRDRDGEIVIVAGGMPVMVKTFLTGQALTTVDAATAAGVGRLLAKLHAVDAPRWLPERYDVDESELAHAAAGDGEFEEWLGAALAQVPADWRSAPGGLVHGDLFPDNILRGRDGALVAIDFEEACRLPFVFDLGMAIAGFAHVHAMTPENVGALLRGYAERRMLSGAERALLPGMTEYGALITACVRHHVSSARRRGDAARVERDWREMAAAHADSRRWREDGVWRRLLR